MRAGGVGGVAWLQTGAVQSYSYGTGSAEAHVPLADHMGNVRHYYQFKASGSKVIGQLVASYEYDAFGREVRAWGLNTPATNQPPGLPASRPWADLLPFHYSSKLRDVDSGFNYYGYRFYDPGAGRWLNRDPIGERGGVNLYGMVGNDAVGRVDVLGLTDIKVTLTRESTGYINTYGSIKVDIINSQILLCCRFNRLEWNTLELPWGRYSLRIGNETRGSSDWPLRSHGSDRASLQSAVVTSPVALSRALGGSLPPRSEGTNEVDYQNAISLAFNTGIGAVNVHAGNGSWHSLLCPIIGTQFVPVSLPRADDGRHPYPGVPDEAVGENHTVYGFDTDDSLQSQVDFNLIFACAKRVLGRMPKVSYSVSSREKPPFKGVLPNSNIKSE